jgi:hypothetical protein
MRDRAPSQPALPAVSAQNTLTVALPDEVVDALAKRVASILLTHETPEAWVGVAEAARNLSCPSRASTRLCRPGASRTKKTAQGSWSGSVTSTLGCAPVGLAGLERVAHPLPSPPSSRLKVGVSGDRFSG